MPEQRLQLVSPVDGSIYAERDAATAGELDRVIGKAAKAQREWRATPIEMRIAKLQCAVRALCGDVEAASEELAWQMGRPVRFGPGELARTAERADHMLAIAPDAMESELIALSGGGRFIRREPIGVVLVIAPWNYPYLTAINSVVPALAAGNAVILKHSPQAILVADRFARAIAEAGFPEGLFQLLNCADATTLAAVRHPDVGHVVFTGSVAVGRIVGTAAAEHFKTVTLELGGKDAAYVRHDADVGFAAQQLADGAFFNSGQSCCSIERIYVHERVYADFVDAVVDEAKQLRLGNPLDPSTTLGPMARLSGAGLVGRHVRDAIERGAKALVDRTAWQDPAGHGCYVPAEVLVDVAADAIVMRDETFGPVVAISKVPDDGEAVRQINNSDFGLTASIWTADLTTADSLSAHLDVGTVFANRCDYLDPALPWSGRRKSGIGLSLSRLAFGSLTRPKSILFADMAAQ